MVMFLHVDKKSDTDTTEENLRLKVIVAKQRAGRTGTFELMFLKEFMQIKNMVGEEIQEYEEQGKWI